MTKRILHLSKHPSGNHLFASDFNGRLHQLSPDLQLLRSSDPMPGRINSLYVITCTEEYVYGRDMQGNLIQWYADNLQVKNIIYLKNFCNEEKRAKFTPIPTMSHGLFIWEDRVLVVSPYGDLLQFESENLQFIKVTDMSATAFAESLDTSIEDCHVLSDCAGYAWYGHVDHGFKDPVRLDYGPIHSLHYDKRHNRHWMTTDNHRGFSLVDRESGDIKRVCMTNDDVEWLTFNEDQSIAYLACFDHFLYCFDNREKTPQLIRKVGPFKFQLKQVLNLDADHTYVSLESGEVYRINQHGLIIEEAPFGSNCIWDIVAHPEKEHQVYCPLEDGGLALIEYDADWKGQYTLSEIQRWPNFGFGRIRRVKPLMNGALIAGCTNGTVFKINSAGGIDWLQKTNSIVRDLALNTQKTEVVAVNEAGQLIQFSVATGEIIWQDQFDKPLWATCYYHDDILVSERCMSDEDQGVEATVPYGSLYRIDGESKEYKLSIELNGNVKRIKKLDNDHILINGNGDVSAIEYDLDERRAVQSWSAWQLNTCEDAIKFNDHIYTVTYGYQLNTYKQCGEMLDCQFSPDNYPKAVYGANTESGVPILLVAGRGPYISLLHIRDGVPDSARTLYL